MRGSSNATVVYLPNGVLQSGKECAGEKASLQNSAQRSPVTTNKATMYDVGSTLELETLAAWARSYSCAIGNVTQNMLQHFLT